MLPSDWRPTHHAYYTCSTTKSCTATHLERKQYDCPDRSCLQDTTSLSQSCLPHKRRSLINLYRNIDAVNMHVHYCFTWVASLPTTYKLITFTANMACVEAVRKASELSRGWPATTYRRGSSNPAHWIDACSIACKRTLC